MLTQPLLSPCSGFIFKQVFGQPGYEDVLISFLNSFIKDRSPIKSLTLKNTEIPRILDDLKTIYLDVRARANDGTEIDIEIQCIDTGEISARAAHCTANLFPMILNKGASYNESKTIRLWIFNDIVLEGTDPVSYGYNTFQPSEHDGYRVLTKNFQIIFIELPKFDPQNANFKLLSDGWLSFLKEPEFFSSTWLKNRSMSKAMGRLKYLSADENTRMIEELRQKDRNNRLSEINNARNEERKKAKENEKKLIAKAKAEKKELIDQAKAKEIESAKNLLKMGLSIEQISQAMGLSIKEIEAIEKKIQ